LPGNPSQPGDATLTIDTRDIDLKMLISFSIVAGCSAPTHRSIDCRGSRVTRRYSRELFDNLDLCRRTAGSPRLRKQSAFQAN
jgi:hypothetical protein